MNNNNYLFQFDVQEGDTIILMTIMPVYNLGTLYQPLNKQKPVEKIKIENQACIKDQQNKPAKQLQGELRM